MSLAIPCQTCGEWPSAGRCNHTPTPVDPWPPTTCPSCAAMGAEFEGYKGGEYIMGANTPLWISEYGEASGTRIMAVNADGTIETSQEEA